MQKNLRDLTIGEAFELLTEDEKEVIYERVGFDAGLGVPDRVLVNNLISYIFQQPTMLKRIDAEMKTARDGVCDPS